MDINGKTAVVTGAATGIGRATALALADAGAAAIALADIDAEKMQQTAAEIERRGTTTLCIPVDVTDIDALEGMFAQAAEELGGFDIVHNNAGIVSGEPLWPETPVRKIVQVAEINLIGIVAGTRIAIDHLSRRGGGVIINTGSIASFGGATGGDDPIYGVTKIAIYHYTLACKDLAESHNIRVNCIMPGVTQTPILGKTGDGDSPRPTIAAVIESIPLITAEEIAAGVLTLVTDDERAGEGLVVDNPAAEGEPPPHYRIADFQSHMDMNLQRLP